MSAIRQALKKLENAVGGLEGSVVRLESSMAGQQRDMFGTPIKKKANGNGHDEALQGALFAQRLDHIIEKVEDVLREA